jgi:hypothetical protein
MPARNPCACRLTARKTLARFAGSSGFTAFVESVINFVYVDIWGDTLALHAIDGVGTEFDSVVLWR